LWIVAAVMLIVGWVQIPYLQAPLNI
jgi:hypothetical protein